LCTTLLLCQLRAFCIVYTGLINVCMEKGDGVSMRERPV
jgi:hypothetical protein